MRARRAVAALVGTVLLVAGCDAAGVGDEPGARHEPAPLRPRWVAGALPVPAGGPGRVLVRDVVACGGRWYAVGAVADPGGATRPAFWASADGRSWVARPVRAESFYGAQNVVSAVGCRGAAVAALGAKSGGAHGNPRVSSWRQPADGGLVEVPAEFEVFGGPRAVDVARIAGGPPGWLIAGGRVAGAAVWTAAPDAAAFTLLEGAPELAGDARGRTFGRDAVAVGEGWLVAGVLLPAGGTGFLPLVWTSLDGRAWHRAVLPVAGRAAGATGADEPVAAGGGSAERVALAAGEPVVLGRVGEEFVLWRRAAGQWRLAGGFGVALGSPAAAGGSGVRSVAGFAAEGSSLVAAVGAGTERSVWWSGDAGASWRRLVLPVPVSSGGDAAVAVAQADGVLLVALDDGRSSGVWSVRVADLVR
ncbi:hypothetical protein [Micromonospora fluostatini]|uniref:hypothetical protein n=1 Tax=Micromonospora sp. JCM 30529 TaxID=3421643 RepID=UPI003D182475